MPRYIVNDNVVDRETGEVYKPGTPAEPTIIELSEDRAAFAVKWGWLTLVEAKAEAEAEAKAEAEEDGEQRSRGAEEQGNEKVVERLKTVPVMVPEKPIKKQP